MLPSSVHYELNKTNRTFFWNKGNNHSPLIGWDKICKNKENGGLNIRKAETMNKALQMKLIWKIITEPDNIWVNIVKGKYLKHVDLFKYSDTKKSKSWQWSQLIKLIYDFKKGTFWCVGNGLSIYVWKDNWIPNLDPNHVSLPGIDKDDNLKLGDLILNQKWNITELRKYFSNQGIEEIIKIKLPTNNIPDKLVWHNNRNGQFTTASAYDLIANNQKPNIDYFSWIWKLNTYPKIKSFLWKIAQDGLPTKVKLQQKHIYTPQNCVSCQCLSEDVFHLFLKCPFTIKQLDKQDLSIFKRIQNINTDNRQTKEILLQIKNTLSKKDFIVLATTWWAIWINRNITLFHTNDDEIIKYLFIYIQNLRKNWEKTNHLYLDKHEINNVKLKQTQTRKKKNISWKKPNVNTFKINFDASVLSNGTVAVGFIIRNYKGETICMDNKTELNMSVLEAETRALHFAIKKAKHLNLSVVEIEGDNLCLMNVINGIWCCPWSINVLVSDIYVDLISCPFFRFSHIFREINQVADRIAKLGIAAHGSEWKNDLELAALIRKDALGWSYTRCI